MTLLYRTLQSVLGYDTVIRRTLVSAAGRNFAFRIAAKPLHYRRVNLLLIAYVVTRYRPIQQCHCRFFTMYRLATIYALQATDRKQFLP